MASVETFEATLKEVVRGKRLSASKVTKLTDIGMKLMEHDTQLVSILYRTHKSLPANAKISSLYAFDALCRAARHQTTKQGLTGDIHAATGNSATFLLKIEGVLDGLVQDMVSTGVPEAKEKTKKILDIWTKASTFPADVLTRLSEVAKAAEKETNQTSTSTTSDPRKHPTPPSEPTPSPAVAKPTTSTPTAESAQAALLALLSSAAAANNAPNSQTPVNTPSLSSNPQSSAAPTQPQLVPAQLALLQQLASKASAGNGFPVQPAPIVFPPRVPQGALEQKVPGPSSRSPPNSEPYPNSDRRDPRFGRYDEPSDGGRGRGDFYDARRGNHRGAPPRGNFRGRGRGDFGGGRDGERDHYRDKDGDRGPSSRRRSSRSRSPPPRTRFSAQGRTDARHYSPPRRPSLSNSADGNVAHPAESTRSSSINRPETGKDEFGRDIRPNSEEPELEPGPAATPIERDKSESREPSMACDEPLTPHTAVEKTPQSPSGVRSSTPGMHKGDIPNLGSAQSWGLESFDLNTFNPIDPASWKALGDAFQITNGYMPSQEELMQLVMGGMAVGLGMGVAPSPLAPAVPHQPTIGDQQTENMWVRGRGDSGPPSGPRGAQSYRGGRGRGGAQGFGRGGQHMGGFAGGVYDQGSMYGMESDAVVLGFSSGAGPGASHGKPQSEDIAGALDRQPSAVATMTDESQPSAGNGVGGQMRKVGDRWMFVRDATQA